MAETRIQQHHLSPQHLAAQLTFMPDACPPRPRFLAVLRYKRLTAWLLDPDSDCTLQTHMKLIL